LRETREEAFPDERVVLGEPKDPCCQVLGSTRDGEQYSYTFQH
jgi:hypothetical protein